LADQGGFTALLAGYLLNVEQIRLAPFLNNSMTLRLEPPLTVTYEEIDYTMKALARVCQLMSYHDYASLYRYLFAGHGDKPGITDYRSRIRTVKSSPLKDEKARHRFAFVIHYPAPEDVVLNNPSFAGYSRENLYRFMQWQSQIKDPGVVCHMPAIRSRSGSTAEGWLIGVPLGGREIMSWPKNEVVDIIARAVDMGRDLGAGIVGLGALTSVVTRGGRAVSGRQVAITSGNSFTTIMAAEAVLLAARKMHVDTASACCGVVGANGSIGRACALMLSEKVSSMLLFGNPDHPGSSKNRLDSLTRDIMTYAWQRMRDGYKEGMSGWLINLGRLLSQTAGRSQQYLARIEAGEDLNLSLLLEICSYIGIACPIQSSLNIAADLPRCDLVIATSNSPEYLIFPADLRSGAVVCDVARPADVAPEVYLHRDDVLVIEGGLVQYPDDICSGPNLGYRDGVNLACLSETILLALEGDYQDYSIGNKLSLATMQYFRDLADKHGFGLAA
jgi:predicted amino acid dehydrogenase